jgi:hypothetical protein
VPAQGSKRFTSTEHGFRVSLPADFEIVPVEPNERQVLARWVTKGDSKREINGVTSTLMVVRIGRQAPVTGAAPDPEQERARERDKSVRDAVTEHLNGGTTLAEFLQRRGLEHELVDVPGKPLKTKNGDLLHVQGLKAGGGGKEVTWSMLACTVEQPTEIFGLVYLGHSGGFPGTALDAIGRSLERGEFKGKDEADVYEGSDLPGIDFRTEVRRKLVKGWQAFDTRHFIFVTSSSNRKLIDDMLVDLEIMRKVYEARFPPMAGIDAVSAVRYCEKYDDYLAYGGRPGTGGYWNFVDEELVLADVRTIGTDIIKSNPNLKNIKPEDVLYHEAMHQYFFYANGHLAPGSWFNEGYGEYFGGTTVDRPKGEPRKIERNRFRMAWVLTAQKTGGKNGAWPDLRTFLKMSQGEFYGGSSLQNYAFAWAFCFFLEQQREDKKSGNAAWAAIPDRYLVNLRELTAATLQEHHIDPKQKQALAVFEVEIQKKAFEATFKDVDLDVLEKAWIEAMKKWR